MIEQRWEHCTIGFYCPNCNAELVADSQNEPRECECGLVYSLVAYLKITPPNTRLQSDANKPCDNFKKARDGKCFNCGFDKKSHRR